MVRAPGKLQIEKYCFAGLYDSITTNRVSTRQWEVSEPFVLAAWLCGRLSCVRDCRVATRDFLRWDSIFQSAGQSYRGSPGTICSISA